MDEFNTVNQCGKRKYDKAFIDGGVFVGPQAQKDKLSGLTAYNLNVKASANFLAANVRIMMKANHPGKNMKDSRKAKGRDGRR